MKPVDTHPPNQPRRGRAAPACCVLAALGLILTAARPAPAQNPAASIDQTRQTIAKWVETRRLISKEKQDWQLARQMLEDRIQVVQREIENLREKIDQTEAEITEADRRRQELVDENERRKATGDALLQVAAGLERRTKRLLPRLPDPIRQTVRPLSQRLPENPDEAEQSLSQRFQNVIGILNEINNFNREITVTSEVRTLEDTSAEVTAMYLGIGQGYYVGARNRIAGIGTADEEKWVWRADNTIADQVARAVAILNNEQVADFVPLPVAETPEDVDATETPAEQAGDEAEADANRPTVDSDDAADSPDAADPPASHEPDIQADDDAPQPDPTTDEGSEDAR